jgi:hypothetical protein
MSLVLEPQDSPDHPMASWFSNMRRYRREIYADKQPRPRTRAAVTMVHNESVFLPIWLGYYSRFFRPEDIYVLDNGTSDGSTRRDGFVRVPAAKRTVDHAWMAQTLGEMQRELLERYDVVLVTDVDEIVAPVPEWGTLGDYIDRFDEPWINCLGYELLHRPDVEPPLDLSRPVLDQRSWWFINDGYDKAALATEPTEWHPGLHARTDRGFNPDPDLRLIHLHRMDYTLCLERHRTRRRKRWAKQDAREGWAEHNRIVGDDEFARWFSEDSCFEGIEIQPERIRESWRGLF